MQIKDFPEKAAANNNDLLLIQDEYDSAYRQITFQRLVADLGGGGAGNKWKRVDTNYSAAAGNNLLIVPPDFGTLGVSLPNPAVAGTEVQVLATATENIQRIEIENVFTYQKKEVAKLKLLQKWQPLRLIYVDAEIGWVSSPASAVQLVFPGGQFVYTSDGDTSGVFYFLGTDRGASSWQNPYTSGRIDILMSSFLGGQSPREALVNRAPAHVHTSLETNPWITFDLKENRLNLNYCSYRFRDNDPQYMPNRLIVSGSNDNVSFTQIADQSIAPVVNGWASFPVSSAESYQYIRFTVPIRTYFTAGEFELYGTLS